VNVVRAIRQDDAAELVERDHSLRLFGRSLTQTLAMYIV